MTGAFTFIAPSSTIIINVAGTYEVTFFVTVDRTNTFALALNGSPLASGVYGSGIGGQCAPGQVVISANAGDLLTVQNVSGVIIPLPAMVGGTQSSTNASICIRE
jgi:hypothetical protein